MKATGSKLTKISQIGGFDIYQDADTLRMYLEIFGILQEVKSTKEASEIIQKNGVASESKSDSSNKGSWKVTHRIK